MRRFSTALLCGGLIVVATGCSSTLDVLSVPEGQSIEKCIPADAEGKVTIGLDHVTNDGSSDVTVTDVELTETSGLGSGAWSVETLDAGETGGALGWETASGSWSHDPIPPGETRQVVVGLQLDDPAAEELASAEATVLYEMNGRDGELESAITFEVSPGEHAPCF